VYAMLCKLLEKYAILKKDS